MNLRVRFLRGTALGGVGNDAFPGDERELPAAQATAFVAAGRAVLVAAQEAEDQPVATPPARARRKSKD